MKNKPFKNVLSAFILGISLVSTHAFAALDSTGNTVHWSYSGSTGPSHWAELSPDFALCSQGQTQSPINIPGNILGNAPHISDLLKINYGPAPLNITDNGPTTLMIGQTQTIINDGHGVQVNFPVADESILYDGTDYHLVQFHIHTPSETSLQGHFFPAEIHFVHQGANSKIAVIAVLIKLGPANLTLQKIINNLPKKTGEAILIEGQKINPADLIPTRQNYYRFKGSLTTPPCTEGLQWIVMAQPITASEVQIQALTAAAGGPNARPIQPLNHRSITESTQKIE